MIQSSWNQSKSRDQKVHKQFPSEMAKRTVINRACKFFINTSDDNDLNLLEAFNRSTENEYDNDDKEELSKVIYKENANKETLEPECEEGQIVDEQTGEVYEAPIAEEPGF